MNKKQIRTAKEAIALVFEEIGGQQKFENWCRTHPDKFYTELYIKLLPYTITAQVDVNVHQADAARSALQDAFERLVAAGDVRTIAPLVIEHVATSETLTTHLPDPQPVAPVNSSESLATRFPVEQKAPAPPPFLANNDNAAAARRRAADTRQRIAEPSFPGIYTATAMDRASDEQLSTTERWYIYGGLR